MVDNTICDITPQYQSAKLDRSSIRLLEEGLGTPRLGAVVRLGTEALVTSVAFG